MADDAKRSGSSKLTATTTLTVQSSKAEVATRLATPSHAPGTAGNYQAFDVLDGNGVPHAIAFNVANGMVA